MQTNGYHIERLPARLERRIKNLLRRGTDGITGKLHQHYRDPEQKTNAEVFETILADIGETIAEVAAITEDKQDSQKLKRISFLPGYQTKSKERIFHLVKFGEKKVPSDLSYTIEKERVVKTYKTISAQALAFYHLLEPIEGDQDFRSGGTHQFLVDNARNLLNQHGYHIELLQVFTGTKSANPNDELTFLQLPVDFTEFRTVDSLYQYFDDFFNTGVSGIKWPANHLDITINPDSGTLKMRGYLVALWYKYLFDEQNHIGPWITDCIKLAESLGFKELENRLKQFRSRADFKNPTRYRFWYSLMFNRLPDFTSINGPTKETLGSAMILSDFELSPQFFFWIQPWIDRMYRFMRDYENVEKAVSVSNSSTVIMGFTGDDRYIPKKILRDRLIKASKGHRQNKPLIFYYQLLYGTPNEYQDGIGDVAKEILDNIFIYHLFQNVYQRSKVYDEWKKDKKNRGFDFDHMCDFFNDQHGDILGFWEKGISCFPQEEGFEFSARLTDEANDENRLRFRNRMIGRLVTLALYAEGKYMVEKIHKTLMAFQTFSIEKSDSAVRYLRSAFFIEDITANYDNLLRRGQGNAVLKHASEFEREFIQNWARGMQELIKSTELLSSNDEMKELLTRALKEDYGMRDFSFEAT